MGNKKLITNDYSKEMAKYLCSQLYGTLNPAYLKCDNLDHLGKNCDCQEIYTEKLNTYDGTLEKYLEGKIFDFIEGKDINNFIN
ncbi:MAG: hypothetical protein U0354_21020 [Candidatus Sericytochromatia bacterium]